MPWFGEALRRPTITNGGALPAFSGLVLHSFLRRVCSTRGKDFVFVYLFCAAAMRALFVLMPALRCRVIQPKLFLYGMVCGSSTFLPSFHTTGVAS